MVCKQGAVQGTVQGGLLSTHGPVIDGEAVLVECDLDLLCLFVELFRVLALCAVGVGAVGSVG